MRCHDLHVFELRDNLVQFHTAHSFHRDRVKLKYLRSLCGRIVVTEEFDYCYIWVVCHTATEQALQSRLSPCGPGSILPVPSKVIGLHPEAVQEARVLNRLARLTNEGVRYAADPWHADMQQLADHET